MTTNNEVNLKKLDRLKMSMFVCTGFNAVVGLGLIACGSWMHASKDVYAYITIFVRSTNDKTLVAAAALMVSSGVILFITAILGMMCTKKAHKQLLGLYMWLLAVVFTMCIVAGFMTTGFYYNIHKKVKNGMLNQLKRHYEWDNQLGKAWNRVQVKKRCCGADGPWDYEQTSWYYNLNPIDAPVTQLVPESCCRLNAYQDVILHKVHPQKLQIKDFKRCQEDTAGRTSNSANVHMMGCFAALFRKNPDLRRDVSIFTVMSTIQGLSLSAGFLQVFAIGLTYWFWSVLLESQQLRINTQLVIKS